MVKKVTSSPYRPDLLRDPPYLLSNGQGAKEAGGPCSPLQLVPRSRKRGSILSPPHTSNGVVLQVLGTVGDLKFPRMRVTAYPGACNRNGPYLFSECVEYVFGRDTGYPETRGFPQSFQKKLLRHCYKSGRLRVRDSMS
jgi:hypothetical protein